MNEFGRARSIVVVALVAQALLVVLALIRL